MDCNILREDINKLKTLRDQFEKKANTATETGTGKIEAISIQKEAEQESDQLLEKYLDDFFDKNPNLLQISFNKNIKGFEDSGGNRASVFAIAPLPNGNMLIGGRGGALYEYQQQPDGTYKLSNPIEGFKTKKGYAADVFAIAPLPNGNILIGDLDGLYECQQQPDGPYLLSKRTYLVDQKANRMDSPSAIAPLSNGDMLISGYDGTLYEYQQQPDGHYQLSNPIERITDKKGLRVTINAIAPLPNGNILIGGKDSDNIGFLCEYQKQSDGSCRLESQGYKESPPINTIAPLPNGNMLIGGTNLLYEYQQQPDGSYRVGSLITTGLDAILPKNPKKVTGAAHYLSAVRQRFRINAIAPLSNGNMLIGGSYSNLGLLCEYQQQPDGSYELSDHLIKGPRFPVQSISSLPNGNILVGGETGDLFELNGPTKSLATLKQSLDKITNQEDS